MSHLNNANNQGDLFGFFFLLLANGNMSANIINNYNQKNLSQSLLIMNIYCRQALTGPLMVPEAIRSPGLILQPLTV